MFLDDELLQICTEVGLWDEDTVNALNLKLYRKCEDYYKAQIKDKTLKQEFKATMDRTFNLWDSFVRQARAHENLTIRILGDLFESYTFRKQWLSNPEMKRIYNSL